MLRADRGTVTALLLTLASFVACNDDDGSATSTSSAGGGGATSTASGGGGGGGNGGGSTCDPFAGIGGMPPDCTSCYEGVTGEGGNFCPPDAARLEQLEACVCSKCGELCPQPCPNYGAASQECVDCVDTLCACEKDVCLAGGR